MAHFGLICPPGTSHVTGLTTVARELARRGHRATVFNIPDVEELADREGVGFRAIGAKDHPKGSFRKFSETFSRMHGMQAMRFGMKVALEEIVMLLQEAPDAMRAAEVTALIVDQGQPAGSTIAEHLGLPFVTICNAVMADPDPNVPPSMFSWAPPRWWGGQLRIRAAWRLFDWSLTPMRNRINSYRAVWGLKPLRSLYDTFSPVLELAQQCAEFDFPRRSLPPQFHYIGLIRREGSSTIAFPFDKLDGRPLVYGSLGTVFRDKTVFHSLAEACTGLDVQLVISLGGNGDVARSSDLAGTPIVVNYAPQLAILERAALTVCHAGNNTVLESLACGVPVVAIPLNTDQYGVSARLEYSRAGERINLKQLSVGRLRELVRRMVSNPSYRERARMLGMALARAGGAVRGADLIEQKLGLS